VEWTNLLAAQSEGTRFYLGLPTWNNGRCSF
jgi:hypothetical protein